MNCYDDIINLPNPNPKKHKRMSPDARAAQFGAFRALTGHEEVIEETARITDDKIILDEGVIEKLNEKINIIAGNIDKKKECVFLYFEKDLKKTGGEYIEYRGVVKKIDDFRRVIIMEDKTEIKIDTIIDIYGDIFE